MASKQIRITDSFRVSFCGICGDQEINQYFGVNDNFIEYCGIYFSFREILSEALDIQIDHNAGKTMEICLDCKDKVIKFYHFKRRVKEVQKSQKINKRSAKDDPLRSSEKRSKVVHSIYQIIENYTEKCSVTAIRVNENTKKLIIESSEGRQKRKLEQEVEQDQEEEEEDEEHDEPDMLIPSTVIKEQADVLCEATGIIKEEPLDLMEAVRYARPDDTDTNNSDDDTYSNSDFITTASTSQHRPAKKQKKDETRRIVISKEIRSSKDWLPQFQREMFSGRIDFYNKHYRIVRLDYAGDDELYDHDSKKFTRPEFRKVKRYHAQCKSCGTKLWAQVKSTFAVKRHIETCRKRSSTQQSEQSFIPAIPTLD